MPQIGELTFFAEPWSVLPLIPWYNAHPGKCYGDVGSLALGGAIGTWP